MVWMIGISCIGIAHQVSMLSPFLDYLQEGNLMSTLHIMGYLKQKNNSSLFLDPTYTVTDKNTFNDVSYCKDLFGDAIK